MQCSKNVPLAERELWERNSSSHINNRGKGNNWSGKLIDDKDKLGCSIHISHNQPNLPVPLKYYQHKCENSCKWTCRFQRPRWGVDIKYGAVFCRWLWFSSQDCESTKAAEVGLCTIPMATDHMASGKNQRGLCVVSLWYECAVFLSLLLSYMLSVHGQKTPIPAHPQ